MSSSSSISSSFRLFTTKLPNPSSSSSFYPKPLNLSFFPKHQNLSSFRRLISFQRIPTTTSSSTSASASASASASSSMPPQSIEELPPKLQETVKLFQSVPVPTARYEQLMFYGKNLKPLEQRFKTEDNKVRGCVSQVWVRAYLDSDNNVHFEADSDALITKGLAALLVNGLSGRPVDEILKVRPDFVLHLGLQQSLSPGRNNGFLNMLKLMQKKAQDLINGSGSVDLGLDSQMGSEKVPTLGSKSGKSVTLDSKSDGGIENLSLKENVRDLEVVGSVGGDKKSNWDELGGRGKRIREALERELSPVELEVEDISYQHAGHAGVRGSGDGETHFNVRVVSNEFEGKSLIKRHRLVYDLLQEELKSGLHALSIVAKTPAEVSGR